MNHILNAQQEEAQAQDSINWDERYLDAYPEDAPVLEALRTYKPLPKRKFNTDEIENFRKYYAKCGSKIRTMKVFCITKPELEEALKNV